MMIDGVKVQDNAICDDREIRQYIRLIEGETGHPVTELTIDPGESKDEVKLDYVCHARAFERIRRITGYLVGTIDRWNNAKKAEERQRVKHA